MIKAKTYGSTLVSPLLNGRYQFTLSLKMFDRRKGFTYTSSIFGKATKSQSN